MDQFHKRLALTGVLLMSLPVFGTTSAYAAKPVNLSHHQLTTLQSFMGTDMHETSRAVSRSGTTHIRIQQTYKGFKVWGADAVIHVPKSGKTLRGMNLQSVVGSHQENASMNGTLYRDIDKDLAQTREAALNNVQSDKALSTAMSQYQQKVGETLDVSAKQATRIVFIDSKNKAHWAYHVTFDVAAPKEGVLPAKPNFILDAETLEVYHQWNNLQTASATVDGGGNGGNKKMGKLSYDGLTGDLHYAKLLISRDGKTCSMNNNDVAVYNYPKGNKPSKIMTFKCASPDSTHNGLFWDGSKDAVNGGYSPSNDALFGGDVIKGMYRDWYDLSVLNNSDGTPMQLVMVVHDKIDNAYWDGSRMTFGDGISMFYPLTSLGVAAHEISHGFTEQHSGLIYDGQSGGMNEAFSDMAAQAAEFYAYGKNSWQIGPEIFKKPDEALRYMDQPSKDCNGGTPGDWCSIDSADQYNDGLDVHFSSGVFNRAFYLMGTAEGWNARKAFDVMVHANQNYWTSDATFVSGACGAIAAAKDLGYDSTVVENAFKTVKVDFGDCSGSSDGGDGGDSSDGSIR